jgi:hypothetical protein
MAKAVRFPLNVPQQVAIKYRTGKQVSNGSVMYSLMDGRVMFVPPTVADTISVMDIQPGQSFFICKRSLRPGNRWDVWLDPTEGQGFDARVKSE